MGLSNSQCRSTADWPDLGIRVPSCVAEKAGMDEFWVFGFCLLSL